MDLRHRDRKTISRGNSEPIQSTTASNGNSDRKIPQSVRFSDKESIRTNHDIDDGSSDENRKKKRLKSALKNRVSLGALDTALIGDYGLATSPSLENLVLHYLDSSKFEKTKTREEGLLMPTLEDADIAGPVFNMVFKHYREGIDVILDDNFWKCFKKRKIKNWNFNIYLLPMWIIGFLFRYLVLFPIRLLVFTISLGGFFLALLFIEKTVKSRQLQKKYEIICIQLLCGVFFFSWGAVVQYHGTIPEQKLPKVKGQPAVNPVFVSNHSSMIDVVFLLQVKAFSLVGQKHKGFAGFLQTHALRCLNCVLFDRGSAKDRAVVSQTLQDHCRNVGKEDAESVEDLNNPLLVFPEGTCVNNEYCIQFKKGVFDLGVPVCPVAIKYQKVFNDPFWSSKDQSFPMHLIDLMTSWCLICDVYFLDEMEINTAAGETAVQFSNRVKSKIAKKAGLISVDFDGYMKHWKPSQRYVDARQNRFTSTLKGVIQESEMLKQLKQENEKKVDEDEGEMFGHYDLEEEN